jgi:hypothetical protein
LNFALDREKNEKKKIIIFRRNILSTKCSVGEMLCRRNVVSTKCSVDEIFFDNFFSTKYYVDEMFCRRNIFRQKNFWQKIFRQNVSTKVLSTKCAVDEKYRIRFIVELFGHLILSYGILNHLNSLLF